MSLKTAYDNFRLAVGSGMLSNNDPRECECNGWGWILSDFDTWHECPVHTGRFHPNWRDDVPVCEWHEKQCWLKAGERLWIFKGTYPDYSEDEHGPGAHPYDARLDGDREVWLEYKVDEDGTCHMRSTMHEDVQTFDTEDELRAAVSKSLTEVR